MPESEVDIMRELFCFLRDHNDPPAPGSDLCTAFWKKAAADLAALTGKWNTHPLALEVGLALYGYLEKKCRAKGEDCP